MDLIEAHDKRLQQLNALDEYIMQVLLHIKVVQTQRKIWHDKHIKTRAFREGDWALLYESRFKDFKGKFITSRLGLYLVDKCHDNGLVRIRTIYEEKIPLLVNGYRLKFYKNPLSRTKFIDSISKEMNFIESIKAPNPFNL